MAENPEDEMKTSVRSRHSSSDNNSPTNELDVIVDLLGVPSDLISQGDLNKRLVLLKKDKNDGKSNAPMLEDCGKSQSCDGTPGASR